MPRNRKEMVSDKALVRSLRLVMVIEVEWVY